MNSQVPSKVFGGEGPQLAWGEESAKRSGRVALLPQGESVLDASMMAELIVTKKEIAPQLKKSAGTSRGRAKNPGVGGQRLPLAGRHGAEHSMFWFLSFGALFAAGFAVSVRTPVEGKIGADRAAWLHRSFKAIRKISGTGRRQRGGHAGLAMAQRALDSAVTCWSSGQFSCSVRNGNFDLPIC